jgi:hypothetical protein
MTYNNWNTHTSQYVRSWRTSVWDFLDQTVHTAPPCLPDNLQGPSTTENKHTSSQGKVHSLLILVTHVIHIYPLFLAPYFVPARPNGNEVNAATHFLFPQSNQKGGAIFITVCKSCNRLSSNRTNIVCNSSNKWCQYGKCLNMYDAVCSSVAYCVILKHLTASLGTPAQLLIILDRINLLLMWSDTICSRVSISWGYHFNRQILQCGIWHTE